MKVKVLDTNKTKCIQLIPETSGHCTPINISWSDLWDICRAGNLIDTRNEVSEYFSSGDFDIRGTNSTDIAKDDAMVDEIARQVISNRIDNESGDQIFDATHSVLMRRKEVQNG